MSGEYKKHIDSKTVVDGLVEMYCPHCERSFSASMTYCPADNAKLIRLVESGDPLLGTVIDERFLLKSRLGAGGMGVVYGAVDERSGREVAIKLINPDKAADRELSKRFLREAKLLSKLGQANTVTIVDFGQDASGALFLVMELLQGDDLGQALKSSGPMPVERVRHIGMQLCSALEAAHNLGIVHRDLKPANIILTTSALGDDHVKVLDFGIAKSLYSNSTSITETDMIVGTPSYVPPETALGLEIDQRSDLYSLGVILYEMIEGTLPFRAESAPQMLRAHVSLAPREMSAGAPEALQQLIGELLAKNPQQRPASANEVRNRLRFVGQRMISAGDTPIPINVSTNIVTPARGPLATGSGPRHPRISTAQRPMRTTAFVGAAVAAAGLIAGLALAWSRNGDEVEAEPPTSRVADVEAPTASARTMKAAGSGTEKPENTAPAAATQEPKVATEVAPVAATPPAQIAFTLSSEPAKATVVLIRDGEADVVLCVATPCDVVVPDVDGTGVLEFRLEGHETYSSEVDLTGGELKTHAVLFEEQPTAQQRKRRTRSKKKGFSPKGEFLSPKKKRGH